MFRIIKNMEKLKEKINIVIETTESGFSAYSEKYPIYTTGRNIPELINNVYEAIELYFDDKYQLTSENIKLEVDFSQFFQYYKVLNADFLAKRIGMNPSLLSQYVHGTKKPSDRQTKKILNGIHRIGQELSELNLITKQ